MRAPLFALGLLCSGLAACGGPVTTDGTPLEDPAPAPEELQEGCGDDDPRVGTTAELVTRAHQVMGTVRIVDNCTVVIEDFVYDGGGLDVRAVVSPNGDYGRGVVLTEDLRNSGGYNGADLELPLPDGITLDDVGGLSIWCLPVGADFGSATL